MRIAYMLTSLGIGGAERQALALAERMKTRGHDVRLIVLRPREEREWTTQVSVIRLDMAKSPGSIAKGLIRGRGVLRSFRPDVLHSHTFPANIAARVFRALGAAPAVLSTIHNIYEGPWHRTLAYRLTDRLSAYTTTVSQAVADRYIQIGSIQRHKCSVIPNGIDLNEFSPGMRDRSRSREAGSSGGDFIWLAAGRDVPAKDFDNLLAAFRVIRQELPKAQLWIAGLRGETRIARQTHKTIHADPGESDGVRWLGLRNDMPETLAVCDAFVLSSAWEGMPLVVGEAMAMERPVVATDVGGVRELVGDAGVIVPAKNSQALADAMLRMMRIEESERRGMGKAARDRIVRHFDVNKAADEWESLYSRLVSDRR